MIIVHYCTILLLFTWCVRPSTAYYCHWACVLSVHQLVIPWKFCICARGCSLLVKALSQGVVDKLLFLSDKERRERTIHSSHHCWSLICWPLPVAQFTAVDVVRMRHNSKNWRGYGTDDGDDDVTELEAATKGVLLLSSKFRVNSYNSTENFRIVRSLDQRHKRWSEVCDSSLDSWFNW